MGSTCRQVMAHSLTPLARAAAINSRSQIVIVTARVRRANIGM